VKLPLALLFLMSTTEVYLSNRQSPIIKRGNIQSEVAKKRTNTQKFNSEKAVKDKNLLDESRWLGISCDMPKENETATE
jgi:hypothetical protein